MVMAMNEILNQIKIYIEQQNASKKWVPGKDFVNYAGPYFSSDEYVAAAEVLLNGWLVMGNKSLRFEQKFPPHFGKKHGVLTNSGSSANLLMMSALTSKRGYNLPKGTKVLMPIAGFPTTLNPTLQVGFTPVFVDIEIDTLNLNIDPEAMLTFDKETPAGYSTYIVNKNGLKYNVTLKVADGQPVKLKDLDKDNVASLQVTNPKQKETVSLPTAGDTDAPKIEREKLVADFPGGKEDDFSGPDPEDVAHGRKAEDDEQATYGVPSEDNEVSASDDCEVHAQPMVITIRQSPQSINKHLRTAFRNKMQNRFTTERRNTFGY